MLTIRHIETNGYESIETCLRLWREPEDREAKDPDFDRGAMVADLGGGLLRTFSSGTLFVMNDNGKTVAKYECAAS